MAGRRSRASGNARRSAWTQAQSSAGGPVSPWSCCTSNTWSGTPTATATRGSATSTAPGWRAGACPCAKSIAPATSASSTTRARRRGSSTRPPGEVVEVELFVAALGASNYTYAEATRTQQVPDWIASHTRALAFFGGVTAAVVCDQLKSGVVRPCRYEPGLQRTYEDSAHYGTAILPARPAKPRDKAKIEAGVLVVERWILARLRHETFFSLAPSTRASPSSSPI